MKSPLRKGLNSKRVSHIEQWVAILVVTATERRWCPGIGLSVQHHWPPVQFGEFCWFETVARHTFSLLKHFALSKICPWNISIIAYRVRGQIAKSNGHSSPLKGSFTIFLFSVRSHILNTVVMECGIGDFARRGLKMPKTLGFYFVPRDLDSQRHMGPRLAAQRTLTHGAGDLDSQRGDLDLQRRGPRLLSFGHF